MTSQPTTPPARSTAFLDAEAARINRTVTDSRARVAAHERELAALGAEVLADLVAAKGQAR